jgi:hypothetical protein
MRLFLLALVLPMYASALRPFDSATCKFQGKTVTVKLESKYEPGDPQDDSGGAQRIQIGGAEAERNSGRHELDFAFNFVSNPASDDPPLCDKTAAFALGGKYVAVIYKADGRPFQDILHLAVYDPATDKVIETKKLGPLGQVIAAPGGFAFTNVVARSDLDTIKHKSPWGKILSGGDDDLEAYRHVSLDGDKIKIEFDPEFSFEKSKWKEMYDKKEDYLSDAGWDPKTATFRNLVVYKTSYFSRKESPEEQICIGMTTARQAGIAKWRCKKFLR